MNGRGTMHALLDLGTLMHPRRPTRRCFDHSKLGRSLVTTLQYAFHKHSSRDRSPRRRPNVFFSPWPVMRGLTATYRAITNHNSHTRPGFDKLDYTAARSTGV